MMNYAIIENNQVKNIIVLPDDFDGSEFASKPVVPANDAAIGDEWDGEKFIKPEPIPIPTEQLANNIRTQRNALLQQSDWTQVADAPVDTQAWAIYRQALRDITEQSGFPYNAQWPAVPGSE